MVTVAVFSVLLAGALTSRSESAGAVRQLKAKYSKKHVRSVEHAKLAALQVDFKSGREVTQACISCHNERHKEIMRSAHWNWSEQEYVAGRGIRSVGKRNIINNFFDCLVCHNGTDTYSKGLAGMPMPDVDLKKIAQNVGLPHRSNCGACHFDGGGGNNVKHGDLELGLSSMTRPASVPLKPGYNLTPVTGSLLISMSG